MNACGAGTWNRTGNRLMIIDIPDEQVPYFAAGGLLFAQRQRRNGPPVPPGVEATAYRMMDRLEAPDADALTRRKRLNREYSRRYRARKRRSHAA